MRARFGRVIVALALVVLMVATLGVRRAPSALAQDDSYESPNYPFALSWDETWTLIEDESSEDDEGDPIDTLTLAHQGSRSGESVVVLIGRRGTVDALECLDVVAEGLSDLPEVSDFAAAEADGEPVQGGDENYAYGAYTLTWESEGDSTSAAATLICASLTPGEELLIVEQLIFPESAFGAEAEALGNLIDDGLVINGRGGNDSAGTGNDTADEPANDGDTGGPPAGSDGPPEGTDGPPDGAAGPPDEEEQP
jgi:hypothetical protein